MAMLVRPVLSEMLDDDRGCRRRNQRGLTCAGCLAVVSWCLVVTPARHFAIAADATAEPVKVLQTYRWEDLQTQGALRNGTVLPAEGSDPVRLRLEVAAKPQQPGAEFSPQTITVLTPPSELLNRVPLYILRGRIRTMDVEPAGFLELWNHFPDGSAYFTRSLAEIGPMQQLRGTTPWREFALPFQKGTAPAPTELTFNLVLPGSGTVEFTNLELVQSDFPSSLGFADADAWWDQRTSGLIGGIGGAFLGLFVGGVLSPLLQHGKARWFVLSGLVFCCAAGVGCCLVAAVAWFQGQPFWVMYPFLVLGGVASVVCAMLIRQAKDRYAQRDLQKMAAMDTAI
jgi:hypothetical protein